MFRKLRQILREWWGPWDKPEPRQAPRSVIEAQDYAQNQQQMEEIEKKLRDGERPRGAA